MNANECARYHSRTNPNTYLTPHSKLYGYCLRDLEQQCKACVSRFDSGAYDTLQFHRAVSHAVGAHTDTLQPSQHADCSDYDDEQLTPTAASASAAASVPAGALAAADTPLRCCETVKYVCLLAPIEGFALVPHKYNSRCMSLDLCLKQLHVVHIKVFHRMQYIRLLLFYSVIFQSCKFQSPDQMIGLVRGRSRVFFVRGKMWHDSTIHSQVELF